MESVYLLHFIVPPLNIHVYSRKSYVPPASLGPKDYPSLMKSSLAQVGIRAA